MPLDFNEIRLLLATIAQTDIAELTLKSDDFELTVRKAMGVISQSSVSQAALSSAASTGLQLPPQPSAMSAVVTETQDRRATETTTVQFPVAAPTSIDPKLAEVTSPMVGTFYRAPAPGEAAFVEVGDRIRNGQTVCIIEAMKLMNEIETEVSGQVIEILVQNGDPIEYGQPLMRINPD